MYICTYLSLGICSQVYVIHSQFLYQLYGLPALCDDKHMPTTITKVTNDSVTLAIVVGMLIQRYSRLQPSIFCMEVCFWIVLRQFKADIFTNKYVASHYTKLQTNSLLRLHMLAKWQSQHGQALQQV